MVHRLRALLTIAEANLNGVRHYRPPAARIVSRSQGSLIAHLLGQTTSCRSRLHLDMSPLPLHGFYKTLVRLFPALLVIPALSVISLLLLPLLCRRFLPNITTHHNNARRPLCLSGDAQFGTTGHVNVGNVVIFGEHGKVRDDVHGRDIGGQDDDAGG